MTFWKNELSEIVKKNQCPENIVKLIKGMDS